MLKDLAGRMLPDYIRAGLRVARMARYQSQLIAMGRRRAQEALLKGDPIRLEIGSGPRKGVGGWLTLDVSKSCDIYWDLLLPLPFPDNSISIIYASHVLEHFGYRDLMSLLNQVYRVLQSGGVISVSVPNAELYIDGYVSGGGIEIVDGYGPALNLYSPIDYVNYIAYMDGHHRHMFDSEGLRVVLERAGFTHVRAREFDPELDPEKRRWESIYAEGAKR